MNASDWGRLVWRIWELIEEHGEELAVLDSLDNGKPYSVARAADVPLAADLFRYMAGWPTKIEGSTVPISALPTPGEHLAYTLREPVGVVGQIIPWNFPLPMAAWKLGPVLACGCTVVLKPAEQTPLSALPARGRVSVSGQDAARAIKWAPAKGRCWRCWPRGRPTVSRSLARWSIR
jgi:phenylacetaldehyde dehydrogenase